MPRTHWNNDRLHALAGESVFSSQDVARIAEELERHGTLKVKALGTGLFPAAGVDSSAGSGYGNVWVRDNAFVAYAHLVGRQTQVAVKAARSLLAFFEKSRPRFEAITGGEVDPDDVMRRPHVRFDGERIAEITDQRWAHAQNDAFGYFLWLCARLGNAGALALDEEGARTLALFPAYFRAIRYWQDEDSGHWEEVRKREASSIGTVVAGLQGLLALVVSDRRVFRAAGFGARFETAIADLVEKGVRALEAILPSECVQLSPLQNRRYDAALIFLIHPLGVVRGPMADLILHDVDRFLTGAFGVRRYLGDSYFAPDYDRLTAGEGTRDWSNDIEARDALLEQIGQEAQWCLFDPMLSALYGERYRETGSSRDRERQILHFQRALAQVTADWRCPELYYLKEGVYVPNPHTPLLWTQANLSIALEWMQADSNGTQRSRVSREKPCLRLSGSSATRSSNPGRSAPTS
jgi:glycosyl hydrolase family 15